MDKNIEILLNSQKNINSVNTDIFNKIELTNKPALINEYDIRNILSVTEIFDVEREENEVYRIYGKIEYLSLLNGLKTTYSGFTHFFTPQTTNSKNILNSFDFYLVRAITGYTPIIGSTIKYVRYFEIIATPDNFELYPAGFSNNVYGEQAYCFNFNVDFDVSTYFDEFVFPATELFIYIRYKTSTNGKGVPEILEYNDWSNTGIPTKTVLVSSTLNVGDIVYGDLIEYSKTLFYQTQYSPQTYYIVTPYFQGSNVKRLIWKYDPFIPLRLRYLSNDLYKANTGDTSYEQTSIIPIYATNIDNNGNYVWRDILPQGYIDPLTNIGVDYPFINKKRYLFTNIIFDIIPDLSDAETLAAFAEIWFSNNAITINKTPIGDLNNIGKPCQ